MRVDAAIYDLETHGRPAVLSKIKGKRTAIQSIPHLAILALAAAAAATATAIATTCGRALRARPAQRESYH